MARNRAVVAASVDTVFAVMADPRRYDEFVVGTKRIRRFDPRWPEAESVFHHTLGMGPFVLRDLTRVVEVRAPHRLVLRAQMRPFAVNRVAFTLSPEGEGTAIEVEEYAIEGPAAVLWGRALERVIWLRNQEMLKRLGKIAQRLQAQRAEASP
ncbi:MAG: SRPBCC family protein [Actinobacteria bacterium]|nr:SRPBCC family protein [Actinomycetota bacterium]